MVVGDLLLRKAQVDRNSVTHSHVDRLRGILDAKRSELYDQAIRQVAKALTALGITDDTPLPRVATQFRRGDLLEPLQEALTLTISKNGSKNKSNRRQTSVQRGAASKLPSPQKKASRTTANAPQPTKQQMAPSNRQKARPNKRQTV
jgi:hypothetical protein